MPVAGERRLPDRPGVGPPHGAPAAGDADTLADFLLGIDLLKRYPVMIAPPLIAMCVVFVAAILFFGSAMSLFAVGRLAGRGPGIMGVVFGGALLLLVFFPVALLINLISSAVVVVMAEDALAARAPSLSPAYARVIARLGDVVGVSFLCALIIGVASVFLVIPGLIAAFFLMFALPAVLLDDAGPMQSLRLSATLVRDNLGRAVGLVIGTVVACVVTWLVSAVLHVVPLIGNLASTLLAGAFLAYLTIVIVRVFQTLPRG